MNAELLSRPILNATDLHRYWQELMNPLGFTRRRLYFVFIGGHGHAVHQLHEISDIPVRPTAEDADALMGVLSHFMDEFRVAVLLTRPGRHPMDEDDRVWARELVEGSHRVGVQLEPLHFANDCSLVPFAGDDLVA